MGDFQDISYGLHKEHFNDFSEERKKIMETWFRDDSADSWRTMRMYDSVKPLIEAFPSSKWLTVGDGRFGLDSIRLKKMGVQDVLPTDISPYLLEKAKQQGLISSFSIENAEKLSFGDGSFDFSFCKDSYHHFPRPYMALYEMLRVAKKAVILTEPHDWFPRPYGKRLLVFSKNILKKLLGKKIHHNDQWNFEDSGNYVYSVSKREMEKTALGLQLPAIGISYFNDYYEKGLEFEKRDGTSVKYRKMKRKILISDIKCKLGLASPTYITAIIFKENPEKKLRDALNAQGMQVFDIPANPYLEKKN